MTMWLNAAASGGDSEVTQAHKVGSPSPAGPLSHVDGWCVPSEPRGVKQGGDIIDPCFIKNTVREVTGNR